MNFKKYTLQRDTIANIQRASRYGLEDDNLIKTKDIKKQYPEEKSTNNQKTRKKDTQPH